MGGKQGPSGLGSKEKIFEMKFFRVRYPFRRKKDGREGGKGNLSLKRGFDGVGKPVWLQKNKEDDN